MTNLKAFKAQDSTGCVHYFNISDVRKILNDDETYFVVDPRITPWRLLVDTVELVDTGGWVTLEQLRAELFNAMGGV
jgi:hypothetical protein